MARRIQILSQEQRITLIRFLAFLSLIRWYNLLVVAVAQYLAAYFILHHNPPWQAVLFDWKLLGVAASTALFIAGGYIINAFYDIEKDLANRPGEVIMGRVISKAQALRAWVLVNAVGLLVSALLKKELLLFNFLFAGALWFYSHKLSKKPLIGDLSAAVLTVAAFFAVCVYYGFVNKVILIYAVFIVLITLIRELVKDLEGMKGDLVYGYQTLPVVKGVKHTKQWLYGLMLSAFVPFAGLYYLVPLNQLLYYFVACGMALLGCGWLIFKAQQPADYTRVNNLLKLLILSGVASIALM